MSQKYFSDLDYELGATRRLLENLPENKMDWKPHDKSWSLAEISTHIVQLLSWQEGILRHNSFDLKSIDDKAQIIYSREKLLELFDNYVLKLKSRLNAMSDRELAKEWTLYNGEKVINRQPKFAAFRTTCLSHLIHHRGQLTVYLRLLDVPLPPVYGPTADQKVDWSS